MKLIEPIFKKLAAGLWRKKEKGDELAKHLPDSAFPNSAFPGETEAAPAQSAPEQPEGRANTVNVTHVWADEANAVKLRVNRVLLPLGEKRLYERDDDAVEAPLAQALFGVEGVNSVLLESAVVTVFMDEEAEWDPIIEKVPEVITNHLEAGLPAVEGQEKPAEAKKFNFGFRQASDRPREEQMRIVQDLLDKEINPAVASHGGFFSLIDVKDDTVYVQLGGGCQGCGMVDVTLRQGVEQRMKEVLPEMVALVDTTDHASGNNPYYSPGK